MDGNYSKEISKCSHEFRAELAAELATGLLNERNQLMVILDAIANTIDIENNYTGAQLIAVAQRLLGDFTSTYMLNDCLELKGLARF